MELTLQLNGHHCTIERYRKFSDTRNIVLVRSDIIELPYAVAFDINDGKYAICHTFKNRKAAEQYYDNAIYACQEEK